jgi:hypothetical protein
MKASHLISFACGVLVAIAAMLSTGTSKAQEPNHVYELRVYHAMPGKLDALKARFKNDTIRIFNNHNMKSVGYWTPQAPNPDYTLVYILQHPNREEATKNWAAFTADPEWVKAKAASEVNGKLVDHVDDTFMDPTDFSMLK